MTVTTAKRIAYTAVDAVAAGILIYMALWAAVTVVEMAVLEQWGQKSESPLPPPGDPWIRVPTLILVLVGGLWEARRSWRKHPLVLSRADLAFLLVMGGGVVAVDQLQERNYLEADYVRCIAADTADEQRRECGRRWDRPDRELPVDSGELVSAGEQACAWLEDRPWGEPPDAAGVAAQKLAVYYQRDLAASDGVLTSEESLSSLMAFTAWYELCPFQQNVHHGDNLD